MVVRCEERFAWLPQRKLFLPWPLIILAAAGRQEGRPGPVLGCGERRMGGLEAVWRCGCVGVVLCTGEWRRGWPGVLRACSRVCVLSVDILGV